MGDLIPAVPDEGACGHANPRYPSVLCLLPEGHPPTPHADDCPHSWGYECNCCGGRGIVSHRGQIRHEDRMFPHSIGFVWSTPT